MRNTCHKSFPSYSFMKLLKFLYSCYTVNNLAYHQRVVIGQNWFWFWSLWSTVVSTRLICGQSEYITITQTVYNGCRGFESMKFNCIFTLYPGSCDTNWKQKALQNGKHTFWITLPILLVFVNITWAMSWQNLSYGIYANCSYSVSLCEVEWVHRKFLPF